MRPYHLYAFLLALAIAVPLHAETCREIHGRAISYTGDGQLVIWHIGTHHDFYVKDDDSRKLLSAYLPEDGSKALFANFTICPVEK
jgi:hypothetical protein